MCNYLLKRCFKVFYSEASSSAIAEAGSSSHQNWKLPLLRNFQLRVRCVFIQLRVEMRFPQLPLRQKKNVKNVHTSLIEIFYLSIIFMLGIEM
jgi:hypothetical protein